MLERGRQRWLRTGAALCAQASALGCSAEVEETQAAADTEPDSPSASDPNDTDGSGESDDSGVDGEPGDTDVTAGTNPSNGDISGDEDDSRGAGGAVTSDATDDPAASPVGREIACSEEADAVSGFARCFADALHRREATACEDLREVSDVACTTDPSFVCTSHGDCEGELEYCNCLSPIGTACATGCLSDADCADTELCLCGDPIGTCVESNCRADSDCEPGAACLSWTSACALTGGSDTSQGVSVLGFACTTDDDECHSIDDCAETEQPDLGCSFFEDGARACGAAGPCGPFVP